MCLTGDEALHRTLFTCLPSASIPGAEAQAGADRNQSSIHGRSYFWGMAGTLARAGNCVFSFPLVSKHKEVNNRWRITWSYTGQHRLQRTPESEKGIIWRGSSWEIFLRDWERKQKILVWATSSASSSWKPWLCGRRKSWAGIRASSWVGQVGVLFFTWLESRERKQKGTDHKTSRTKAGKKQNKTGFCVRSRSKPCQTEERFPGVYRG